MLVLAGSHEPHNRRFFAKVGIHWLVVALHSYRNDVGSFPEALEALASDPQLPGWRGPYLRDGVPLDPWGHEYVYRKISNAPPEVLSLGADGAPGGDGPSADISSLRLDKPDRDEYVRRMIFVSAAAGFFGLSFLPALVRIIFARRHSIHQNFQSPS